MKAATLVLTLAVAAAAPLSVAADPDRCTAILVGAKVQ